MALTRIYCEHFTAFEKLDIDFSQGLNVFVGANGMGKTHLMKLAYASCDITLKQRSFAEKIESVFLPSEHAIGRLVTRKQGVAACKVSITREDNVSINIEFTSKTRNQGNAKVTGEKKWIQNEIESVYIPVKEMLSMSPGFIELYERRDLNVEEIYVDILKRASLPPRRGPNPKSNKMLNMLNKKIDGKVEVKNEEYFLRNKQGLLEFTLVAEGLRKLGLLWKLIQNGTLINGSVLFWDEPETNLNPSMYKVLVEILLELQRNEVQIFIATHDYAFLKEIEVAKKNDDAVLYHALYHGENRNILSQTTDEYIEIDHNAIADAFSDLYDREVTKSLGVKK